MAPLLDRASPLRSRRICAIRSGRKSTSPANPSSTRWRRRSTRIRSSSACDTSRTPRDAAVIKAAAEKFGWETRPSPRRDQTGDKVNGRGIAYSQRNGTRVAAIAEVDIDRSTGKIWVKRFVVAHDCGQIINPDGLAKAIEGNVVQGISRTLWEEVKFNDKTVTTVDWVSYPILDITESPEKIEVVLIDHPEIAPSGAGEPSIRPLAAAIANAIFDATGVRMRRVPFSPDRVKQSMS